MENKTNEKVNNSDNDNKSKITLEDYTKLNNDYSKLESEFEKAKKEIEKIKQHNTDCTNVARTLQADFDNYRRNMQLKVKESIDEGISKAVKNIIPALDAFKKAEKIISDRSSISGIRMIEKQILHAFEKLQVTRIPALGEEFNPEFHNAVMLVEDKNSKSGTIVEELESGYIFHDKVIKHSQVVVAK